MKREPTGQEKVFADRISDKGLMSKIHEELMQFKRQKKKKHKTEAGNTHTTPSKMWAQRLSISPKAPQVPPDEQVREKTLRITLERGSKPQRGVASHLSERPPSTDQT